MSDYQLEKDILYYPEQSKIHGNREYALERCKLDVYYHPRRKLPVLIHFHGGGLVMGGKSILPCFQEAGLVVVAVDYRLSGDLAKCPDYLEDAAAAVAWTVQNIAKWNGDVENIILAGGSGGAYLAAMVALDARYLAPWGITPDVIDSVCTISGQMTTHFQILSERQQAGEVLDNPVVIDEYAPIYHAKTHTPRFVCIVGDPEIEWPARVEENQLFAAIMKRVKSNPNVEVHQLSGFDHNRMGIPGAELIKKRISDFVREKFLKHHPMEIDLRKSAFEAQFVNRSGECFEPVTKLSMRQNGSAIDFVLENQGKYSSNSGKLWSEEHFEIFIAPEFEHPEQAVQIGIHPNGSTDIIGYGISSRQFPKLSEVKTEPAPEGYRLSFKLHLDNFLTPKTAGINIFRAVPEGTSFRFSNLNPTFMERNFLTDSFVPLSVNALV